MKISIKLATVLLCFFIMSCEHDNITNSETSSEKSAIARITAKNNEIHFKVNNRGYLMFENENEVALYIDYIANQSLGEVLDVFAQYNFQPLNSTDYDKAVNPEKFTFNSAGLVQIGNSVFKISDDGLYLLSIQENYMLDDAIFQMMASGDFQPQLMNRFSLLKDRGNADFNIFDMAEGNPSGINEEDPPVLARGKFWGKEEYPQPCNGMNKRWVNVVHHAFWIQIWVTGYFEDC